MIHKLNETDCLLEIKQNVVFASVYLSDACGSQDASFLESLVDDFATSETEVGIDIGFKLEELLTWTIECHAAGGIENLVLDIDSKPIFDKTKLTLLKIIEQIDSLKFEKA